MAFDSRTPKGVQIRIRLPSGSRCSGIRTAFDPTRTYRSAGTYAGTSPPVAAFPMVDGRRLLSNRQLRSGRPLTRGAGVAF